MKVLYTTKHMLAFSIIALVVSYDLGNPSYWVDLDYSRKKTRTNIK